MSEEELRRLLAVHNLPTELGDMLRDEVEEAYARGKVDEQHRQNKRERDKRDAQRAHTGPLTAESIVEEARALARREAADKLADVLVNLFQHALRHISKIRYSEVVERLKRENAAAEERRLARQEEK
jgi:hypothetical protein